MRLHIPIIWDYTLQYKYWGDTIAAFTHVKLQKGASFQSCWSHRPWLGGSLLLQRIIPLVGWHLNTSCHLLLPWLSTVSFCKTGKLKVFLFCFETQKLQIHATTQNEFSMLTCLWQWFSICGSHPLCGSDIRYLAFTLQFITAVKLQLWSSNGNHFMIRGHHNMGNFLEGQSIMKFENH